MKCKTGRNVEAAARRSKRKSAGDPTVGYCRPPIKTRFAKGRSGNPAGRPRGRKSLRSSLESILHRRISVREGDQVRSISQVEALLKVLVNAGLKGNYSTALKVIDLLGRLQVGASDSSDEPTHHEITMTITKPAAGEDRSYREAPSFRSS